MIKILTNLQIFKISRFGKPKIILHISKYFLLIVLSAVFKVKLSRLSIGYLCGNVKKQSQTKAKNRLWTKNAVICPRLYHVYNTVRQYFELYRPFDKKLGNGYFHHLCHFFLNGKLNLTNKCGIKSMYQF